MGIRGRVGLAALFTTGAALFAVRVGEVLTTDPPPADAATPEPFDLSDIDTSRFMRSDEALDLTREQIAELTRLARGPWFGLVFRQLLPSAENVASDPWFNPEQHALPEEQLLELQRRIDGINLELERVLQARDSALRDALDERLAQGDFHRGAMPRDWEERGLLFSVVELDPVVGPATLEIPRREDPALDRTFDYPELLWNEARDELRAWIADSTSLP